MSYRTIDGDSFFLNYVTSIAFRSAEVLRLRSPESSALWELLASGVATHPLRKGGTQHLECDLLQTGLPTRLGGMITHGHKEPIWRPYLFRVELPIRFTPENGSAAEPRPSSMKCECLFSIFGIAVKLRFAFRDVAREQLVDWPNTGRFRTWQGEEAGPDQESGWSVGEVCWLVVEATLDSLKEFIPRLEGTQWKSTIERNVRRIYCEIAEKESDTPVPDDALFVNLAQYMGTRSSTDDRSQRSDRIRRSKGSRELHLCTPTGAALYLTYTPGRDNESWRGANCHRRDVGYSIMLHNLLCAQIEYLHTELTNDLADEPGFETRSLAIGSVAEVANRRMQLLAAFHERYWWLAYYSTQRHLSSKLQRIRSDIEPLLGDAAITVLASRLAPDGGAV